MNDDASQPALARKSRQGLPLAGLLLSLAGFLLVPSLVMIGMYMPIFDSMTVVGETAAASDTAVSFGFGWWALLAVAAAVPGLAVSTWALVRAQQAGEALSLAIGGVTVGVVTLIMAASYSLILYSA